MADVTIDVPDRDSFRDADRGQLLLVAGLMLAVALVVLVVLLNATIYSENVATRGIESGDGEALEVRSSAVEGVGDLIDATNRRGAEDYDAVSTAVADGIEEFDEHTARRYARRGGVARVERAEPGLTAGWYLETTGNDSSLANASNATTYTVANEVERTRGFTITVDVDSLAVVDVGNASERAFGVTFDDADPDGGLLDKRHEAYLFRPDDGSDDVAVAIGIDGATPETVCRVTPDTFEGDGTIRLDVTGDRVYALDGTGREVDTAACIGVWPDELHTTIDPPTEPYDIGFVNADAADGTAAATVRTAEESTIEVAEYAAAGVYDATIRIHYRTADLAFETTVRVAPGEPYA